MTTTSKLNLLSFSEFQHFTRTWFLDIENMIYFVKTNPITARKCSSILVVHENSCIKTSENKNTAVAVIQGMAPDCGSKIEIFSFF